MLLVKIIERHCAPKDCVEFIRKYVVVDTEEQVLHKLWKENYKKSLEFVKLGERNIFKIKKEIKLLLKELKKDIKEKRRLLKSFSPREVLKRGYSIVEKEGEIVKNAADLEPDQLVNIKLHKGGFQSLIKKINYE